MSDTQGVDLEARLEDLREWVEHKRGCRATEDSEFGQECDCGLDAVLYPLLDRLRRGDEQAEEWRRAALQARSDLVAAPVDLGMAADTRWVEWSNQGNTIRWIDRLERAPRAASSPAPAQTQEPEAPEPVKERLEEMVSLGYSLAFDEGYRKGFTAGGNWYPKEAWARSEAKKRADSFAAVPASEPAPREEEALEALERAEAALNRMAKDARERHKGNPGALEWVEEDVALLRAALLRERGRE